MADTQAPAMSLTNMLSRFGVNYPNAPEPTPAQLAFMRGIGLSMDTAEDAARTNELRMKERATQSREEISRQNDRSLTRMAGDLQSRGVLSSGETNTRVARQAEDVARQQGEVEQTLAEGIDRSKQGLATTGDMYRQQMLEKTLGLETDNATRAAVSAAQEQAWKRQQDADEASYQRTRAAQEQAYKQQEDLYKKYAGFL